jgi:DNA-directed RNA polymerase alpha subunit
MTTEDRLDMFATAAMKSYILQGAGYDSQFLAAQSYRVAKEMICSRKLVIDEMRGEGDETLMFIDELEFTVRTSNCLKGAGIKTVGQLKQWTRNDLLKLPNLGSKSIKEIDEITKENGIELRGLKHD